VTENTGKNLKRKNKKRERRKERYARCLWTQKDESQEQKGGGVGLGARRKSVSFYEEVHVPEGALVEEPKTAPELVGLICGAMRRKE